MFETTTSLREEAIRRLLSHKAELAAKGVVHLDLFGSVARGDDTAHSDIDVCVELDYSALRRGFSAFADIENLRIHLGSILGRRVDLVTAPIHKARLKAEVDRDAVRAF